MSDTGGHQPNQLSDKNKRGIYFRREDTPGLFLRLLIALMDFLVVVAIYYGLGNLILRYFDHPTPLLFASAVGGTIWLYLVVLKRTRLGTLAYALFGVKVTDLAGEKPGIARLTLRQLLGWFFNPLIDYGFSTGEASRQCLRDKLSGTYVVMRGAVSQGQGEIVYATLFMLNMSLIYREVKRKD